MGHKELVLGGARSGKSRIAQSRATESGRPVTFIATAEPGDAEMGERIARHKRERPAHWQTLEVPLNLPEALTNAVGDDIKISTDAIVLVDCLTLWLNNLFVHFEKNEREAKKQDLLASLRSAVNQIILVSNEVGQGIVPANALSRQFADEAGWLNQDIANVCEKVTLCVAGIEVPVKS